MVPQYPFNTETANIWRRSVVPSVRSSPIIYFFVSCLPAGVLPSFVSVAMSRTDVGRIMTTKGRCQPLFERTLGLSFFFAPFCHAQPSPAPSRLVCPSRNLDICGVRPDGSLGVWTTPHGAKHGKWKMLTTSETSFGRFDLLEAHTVGRGKRRLFFSRDYPPVYVRSAKCIRVPDFTCAN